MSVQTGTRHEKRKRKSTEEAEREEHGATGPSMQRETNASGACRGWFGRKGAPVESRNPDGTVGNQACRGRSYRDSWLAERASAQARVIAAEPSRGRSVAL